MAGMKVELTSDLGQVGRLKNPACIPEASCILIDHADFEFDSYCQRYVSNGNLVISDDIIILKGSHRQGEGEERGTGRRRDEGRELKYGSM